MRLICCTTRSKTESENAPAHTVFLSIRTATPKRLVSPVTAFPFRYVFLFVMKAAVLCSAKTHEAPAFAGAKQKFSQDDPAIVIVICHIVPVPQIIVENLSE